MLHPPRNSGVRISRIQNSDVERCFSSFSHLEMITFLEKYIQLPTSAVYDSNFLHSSIRSSALIIMCTRAWRVLGAFFLLLLTCGTDVAGKKARLALLLPN